MNQFFISDLHLGHKNILKFSPQRGGTDMQSHSEWIVNQWNSVVKPKDLVWVLGDICFDGDHLNYLKMMNGTKNLIMGNHDGFSVETYKLYFDRIDGLRKKYKMWLSHAPLHYDHLRGMPNIHGHLHDSVVMSHAPYEEFESLVDTRYLNVSVEQLNGIPISLEEVRDYFNQTILTFKEIE